MFKHILIATDGSAASEHAAQLAVGLARVHGAKLTAVYVADPYPYVGIGEINPMGFQAYMDVAHEQASRAHSVVDALCKQDGAAIALQVRMVEEVAPAAGIVQSAKEVGADLIVLGSHGRSGIARLMLGSVADRVVHESTIPVLITR